MPIHIGFTGTRNDLSGSQLKWLKDELVMLDLHTRLVKLERPVLHHGDCVGGDATAHAMAQALGWDIQVHPPIKERYRAFCKGAQETHQERGYLARND